MDYDKLVIGYGLLFLFILPYVCKLFNNKILFMNVSLIVLGYIIFKIVRYPIFIFLGIIIFIINEIFSYLLDGPDIYPKHEKTKLFYELTEFWHYRSNRGTGNYSDGYYPNEESKLETNEENAIRKYKYWKEIMNIEKGETVLEAGCGSGEFLKFLKEEGINVVGITLSEEAVKRLNNEGIESYYHDFREAKKEFENRFDHIMFPGSLEHLTPYAVSSKHLEEKQIEDVDALIKNIDIWFKCESKKKHLFTAVLHSKKKYNNTFAGYLLERTYGGSYMPDEENRRIHDIILKNNNYTKTKIEDRTFDYYYSSIRDHKHFGYPGSFEKPEDILSIFAFIFSPFTYPYLMHMVLYDKLGVWMWMFDGKLHPLGMVKCELLEERPVSYWYSVMKKND